jgi:hypothetical protein
VRIPLDYYKILGVHPQMESSQLEQAYQDRLLQLPRREYSETAIDSRRHLVEEAYRILQQPDSRSAYDRDLAAATTAEPPRDPEIEIPPSQFLGALLILFEQGEYEEVNTICLPYLGNNGRTNNSGSLSGNLLDSQMLDRLPDRADIILTMVLSFIELGKKEWREHRYEDAGTFFEAAHKVLAREDLFPHVQGEIERNLDKLRPYRILHLVALPLEREESRQRGLSFLSEMLEICQENRTNCKERFGLSSDDGMLKFLDQIRRYLTTSEQHQLFGHLANHSEHPLCTYLYVYALIARGFSNHNPQFIYQAKQLCLHRLAEQCDVRMEQAICALLLGQSEEASQMVASLPQSEKTVVIRQQSQGSPDLMPGFYWYVQEEWLPKEILCYFRDLNDRQPSLAEYFEDLHVQTYIEHLPAAENIRDRHAVDPQSHRPRLIEVPISGDLSGSFQNPPPALTQPMGYPGGIDRGNFATRWQSPLSQPATGNIPTAERVVQTEPAPPPSSEVPLKYSDFDRPELPSEVPPAESMPGSENTIDFESERRRRRPQSMPLNSMLSIEPAPDYPSTNLAESSPGEIVPVGRGGNGKKSGSRGNITRRRRRRTNINVPRLLLVTGGGVACTAATVLVANSAWNGIQTALKSGDRPSNSIPTATVPSPPAQKPTKPLPPAPIVGMLTANTAQQLVERWLNAKAKSLGKDYELSQLSEILVEPALSKAKVRSMESKQRGVHWLFQHQVSVDSPPSIDAKANAASVQARVVEDAKFHVKDRHLPNTSYKKDLRVKYDLIRKADRWYIKNMAVIN